METTPLEMRHQSDWGRILLAAPSGKNKLSLDLLERLHEGLAAWRRDSDFRLVTLESTCPDLFAAGADMNELLNLDRAKAREYAALGQSVMRELETFPTPVVALVGGPCFGGGFDLALACAEIWATDNAVFCHPGAYLGIITGFGGTVRLPLRLPTRMARHMLLTGYRMGAEEAGCLGLVQRRFPSRAAMLKAAEARASA
ncbi:Enoyl-CoA hydratase/isomerase family protein [Sulfidibacter corallicola]|uniref:Enoyl-CoA hydratase/isomerase family protein n=1 Tax=Sulfidibacter corallicola TaxID=2818388 RepID=A0A8A4TR64_SULCO|nr:enoyl-CoA hydratase/isomerase family protein [Sulfidibacter corallicola]QTD52013.1 enoyl-CoA hydratase/isomerase family protein [Sulfidibacter corallicola]